MINQRHAMRSLRIRTIIRALCTTAFTLIINCDFPYAPQRQPAPYSPDAAETGPVFTGTGTIYPVNVAQQTCNPSIVPQGFCSSSGPEMLFLGYDHLSVTTTDSAFTSLPITMHDRLMVVDTANIVRWYFLRSSLAPAGDLQCPEWSTHCNYCTCLLGSIEKPYSGYAIRRSDRHTLKLCDALLDEFSTPFLYLADSAETAADGGTINPTYTAGFADRTSVLRFFGTTAVKYLYTHSAAAGTLYYVDYLADAVPTPHPLAKPAGKESWYCASPVASHDGNWVAYHCFSNATKGPFYASYIQRLKPGSRPVLIADGASDPHWWRDPQSGIQYIIYSVTSGDYFTEYDFTDTTIESGGSAGYTLKQRLSGTTMEAPVHSGTLEPDRTVPPDTLIRLPFKGGLSVDGYYLCTAYKFAYLTKLAGN
jgi:hypothetical protein